MTPTLGAGRRRGGQRPGGAAGAGGDRGGKESRGSDQRVPARTGDGARPALSPPSHSEEIANPPCLSNAMKTEGKLHLLFKGHRFQFAYS